jgi:hypothetical protein
MTSLFTDTDIIFDVTGDDGRDLCICIGGWRAESVSDGGVRAADGGRGAVPVERWASVGGSCRRIIVVLGKGRSLGK